MKKKNWLIAAIIIVSFITGCAKEENNDTNNSVRDIDGNNYKTINIGNQVWMAENLKTTKYRNGDPIITNLNDYSWTNSSSGAYSIYSYREIDGYNSDKEVFDVYGALYNWYAVVDERGLCPTGWHVPSDYEWDEFIYSIEKDYLNYENSVGGKLKSKGTTLAGNGLWLYPNAGATNETGFSAIPAGVRGFYGENSDFGFIENGRLTMFWSTDDASPNFDLSAWSYALFNYSEAIGRDYYRKTSGFSVRCVKD